VPPILHDYSAWAIRPEAFAAVRRLIAGDLPASDVRRLLDEPPQSADAARARAQSDDGRADVPRVGSVGVLKLRGVIQPNESFLSWLMFGSGGSLQEFRRDLRACMADDTIKGIVLHVDSPGGRCDLVQETAAEVRAASAVKPIFAVANTSACSAAYHIASQATELSVTPSGYVGSIGIYMLHIDWSGFNAEMGLVYTYVHAGKYKVEGNEDEPLGDEAKAAWQAEVDDIYDRFARDVALARGVPEATARGAEFGDGRVMLARQAVAAGMCDRVETFEQAVDRLRAQVDGSGSPIGSGAAADAAGSVPSSDDAGGARADLPRTDDEPPEAGADAGEPPEPDNEPDPPVAKTKDLHAEILAGVSYDG
jgi:signal peptide peptidase SppA